MKLGIESAGPLAPARAPRRGLSSHVETTLSRARMATIEGYRTIGVRPDGVILSKRAFGKDHTIYFATDPVIGAP